jgi:hypothetical protein
MKTRMTVPNLSGHCTYCHSGELLTAWAGHVECKRCGQQWNFSRPAINRSRTPKTGRHHNRPQECMCDDCSIYVSEGLTTALAKEADAHE